LIWIKPQGKNSSLIGAALVTGVAHNLAGLALVWCRV
jgi:hypothetical protein